MSDFDPDATPPLKLTPLQRMDMRMAVVEAELRIETANGRARLDYLARVSAAAEARAWFAVGAASVATLICLTMLVLVLLR